MVLSGPEGAGAEAGAAVAAVFGLAVVVGAGAVVAVVVFAGAAEDAEVVVVVVVFAAVVRLVAVYAREGDQVVVVDAEVTL